MNPYDGVIFDYGNVLSREQDVQLIAQMADELNCDIAQFEHCYWAYRPQYDSAAIDGIQYWGLIASDLGIQLQSSSIRRLIDLDNASWSIANEVIVGCAERLRKQGTKTAILSNMPADLRWQLSENCAWLPRFDQETYSCEIHLTKPDPAIYSHCLKGLRTEPARTLFIDDRLPNVEAARNLGLQTIHFLTTAQVVAELHSTFGWETYEKSIPTT